MDLGQPSRFESSDTEVERTRKLNDTCASVWRIFQLLSGISVTVAAAAEVFGHTSVMPDPNALNGDHDRRYYTQSDVNSLLLGTYGGVSVVENAVETAILVAGTKVQFTGFDTNSPSSRTTPDHTNDHIIIDSAGNYLVICVVTVESVAGAASVIELEVMKNNGNPRVGALHTDRSMAGGGGDKAAMSMADIVTLAKDDTIELWVENETNTQNYLLEDVTLLAVKLER